MRAVLAYRTKLTPEQKTRAADLAEQCVSHPDKVITLKGWTAVQANTCLNRAFAMVTGMKVQLFRFRFSTRITKRLSLKKNVCRCCHIYIGLPRAYRRSLRHGPVLPFLHWITSCAPLSLKRFPVLPRFHWIASCALSSSNVYQCCHIYISLPRARPFLTLNLSTQSQ